MSKQKHSLNVGDAVAVKPGTADPDTGGDIGGWQGRISEINEAAEKALTSRFATSK
jgi:hypothetical protein